MLELNEWVLYGTTFTLGLISVWALIELIEKRRWTLWGIIPAIFIAVWALTWSTNSLKGMPTQQLPKEEWVLISHFAIKDHGIYLWVLEKGKTQPTSVKIPWSKDAEEKVKGARKKNEKTGRPVIGKFNEQSKDMRLWEFDVESTLPKKGSSR